MISSQEWGSIVKFSWDISYCVICEFNLFKIKQKSLSLYTFIIVSPLLLDSLLCVHFHPHLSLPINCVAAMKLKFWNICFPF